MKELRRASLEHSACEAHAQSTKDPKHVPFAVAVATSTRLPPLRANHACVHGGEGVRRILQSGQTAELMASPPCTFDISGGRAAKQIPLHVLLLHVKGQ